MKYELLPTNGRKSFYGKAIVIEENGIKTLFSYDTAIITLYPDGTMIRHYDGKFTATTGTHILAFCGLKKADFMKMEVKPYV